MTQTIISWKTIIKKNNKKTTPKDSAPHWQQNIVDEIN